MSFLSDLGKNQSMSFSRRGSMSGAGLAQFGLVATGLGWLKAKVQRSIERDDVENGLEHMNGAVTAREARAAADGQRERGRYHTYHAQAEIANTQDTQISNISALNRESYDRSAKDLYDRMGDRGEMSAIDQSLPLARGGSVGGDGGVDPVVREVNQRAAQIEREEKKQNGNFFERFIETVKSWFSSNNSTQSETEQVASNGGRVLDSNQLSAMQGTSVSAGNLGGLSSPTVGGTGVRSVKEVG